MTRLRRMLVVAALATCGWAASGCTMVACAGASAEPPHVELDLSYWFRYNPTSTVTACFDDVCQTTGGAAPALKLQLVLADSDTEHPDRPYDLSVETSIPGAEPHRSSQSVNLTEFKNTSPCGSHSEWMLPVVLDPNDTLDTSPADGLWLPS
ncbi:hypothetical protein [Subtercola sp. YIM 133946]|uniref:hypothetical protein n=1 Tax=Subtercola sp. YIM 133946 TaxID=3118909 RepID=UPI002F91F148